MWTPTQGVTGAGGGGQEGRKMQRQFRSRPRRNVAAGLATLPGVGLLAAAPPAWAQIKYPTHSPRLVLPFAAGGVADVTARIVSEKLGDKLAHRLVGDNQPGAGGINAAKQGRSPRPAGATPALLGNGTPTSRGRFTSLL